MREIENCHTIASYEQLQAICGQVAGVAVTTSAGDTEVSAQVRRYWDRRAETYDGHTPTTGDDRDWLMVYTHAMRTMRPGHPAPLDILEVGVGTGYLAILLAEAGHRVTGVDISPQMLARAETRAAARGVTLNLVNGDAHPLPALPGRFDVVTCRNLLWTLQNPAAALASWRSALRPGGTLLISDAMWNDHPEDVWHPKPDADSGDPVYQRFWNSYRQLRASLPFYRGLTPDDAHDLMRAAGYRDQQRFDPLFETNPAYDPPSGFFVIGAHSAPE